MRGRCARVMVVYYNDDGMNTCSHRLLLRIMLHNNYDGDDCVVDFPHLLTMVRSITRSELIGVRAETYFRTDRD